MFRQFKTNIYSRCISLFLLLTFGSSSLGFTQPAFVENLAALNLPVPGSMVTTSPAFTPILLKGMTLDPKDPFHFDFIVDSGNTQSTAEDIKKESDRLIKYFMASMTVPKNDLWVNLSPNEKDRIIPEELGKTELGRDLLAQDYILKQLSSTLMYPESELGAKFWEEVYSQARDKYGVTDIPLNTFNKVWILPESASVYEHGNSVYITESHLKVMLDEDYLSMETAVEKTSNKNNPTPTADRNIQLKVLREVILPAIEKEVNTGKNFAPLRQIYQSLILAKWYKETVRQSILSQIYIDKNKVGGLELNDPSIKEKIYERYIEAYKKGVYDYMKEDYDQLSQTVIPRKYFSGGFKDSAMMIKRTDAAQITDKKVGDEFVVGVDVNLKEQNDNAMLGLPTWWHINRLRSNDKEKQIKSLNILRNRKSSNAERAVREYENRNRIINFLKSEIAKLSSDLSESRIELESEKLLADALFWDNRGYKLIIYPPHSRWEMNRGIVVGQKEESIINGYSNGGYWLSMSDEGFDLYDGSGSYGWYKSEDGFYIEFGDTRDSFKVVHGEKKDSAQLANQFDQFLQVGLLGALQDGITSVSSRQVQDISFVKQPIDAAMNSGDEIFLGIIIVGAISGAYHFWTNHTISGNLFRLKFSPFESNRYLSSSFLAFKKEPRAVNLLISRLNKSLSRKSAISDLGKIGDPRAVVPLLNLLTEENFDLWNSIIKSLGEIGDPRAFDQMVNALTVAQRKIQDKKKNLGEKYNSLMYGQDNYLLVEFAKALGKLKDNRGVPFLINLINSGYWEVKKEAIEALVKIKDQSTYEKILNEFLRLLSERNIQIIEEVGKFKDSRAVEPLINLLSDQNDGVKVASIKALGEIGDLRAVKSLIKIITNNQEVRSFQQEAAEALLKIVKLPLMTNFFTKREELTIRILYKLKYENANKFFQGNQFPRIKEEDIILAESYLEKFGDFVVFYESGYTNQEFVDDGTQGSLITDSNGIEWIKADKSYYVKEHYIPEVFKIIKPGEEVIDHAQLSDVGGIDMNNIEVKKQGKGTTIQFDPMDMNAIINENIQGFVPVIINVTPINSVLPILGLEPKKSKEDYKVS